MLDEKQSAGKQLQASCVGGSDFEENTGTNGLDVEQQWDVQERTVKGVEKMTKWVANYHYQKSPT
jgi:hypothetical protein